MKILEQMSSWDLNIYFLLTVFAVLILKFLWERFKTCKMIMLLKRNRRDFILESQQIFDLFSTHVPEEPKRKIEALLDDEALFFEKKSQDIFDKSSRLEKTYKSYYLLLALCLDMKQRWFSDLDKIEEYKEIEIERDNLNKKIVWICGLYSSIISPAPPSELGVITPIKPEFDNFVERNFSKLKEHLDDLEAQVKYFTSKNDKSLKAINFLLNEYMATYGIKAQKKEYSLEEAQEMLGLKLDEEKVEEEVSSPEDPPKDLAENYTAKPALDSAPPKEDTSPS